MFMDVASYTKMIGKILGVKGHFLDLCTALLLLAFATAVSLAPSPALAQERLLRERPGAERPELPLFEPEAPEPGTILPPLPAPEKPDLEGLSRGLRVRVREIRITGNTALSDEELAVIADPFENRSLSFADLQDLRDRLTLAYVKRGYVTSGAVIPEQLIREGVVEIRIVEGVLAAVDIETDGRFRPSHLQRRLERRVEQPVNLLSLEEQLQILQQDWRIERVDARLVPDKRLGEALLRVAVAEEEPYRLRLDLDNHESPSIGAEGGRLDFRFANLVGVGDVFRTSYGMTEGLRDLDASYEIPLNAWQTTLDFHLSESWSEVIDENFESLDIEGRSSTYGATLRHPLHRSLRSSFDLFLTGEWRRSKSYLLGSGFAFSEGPSDEGVSQVTVLRFGQDWSHSTRNQVFAARSMLSWGIDALGATTQGGDTPDGKFLAWLGQVQWARRFDFLDAQLIARFDVQLTESPLLGLEQFAIGGFSTVRGYRENTLVRDNGLVGSIEARIPVWRRGRSRLELATFFDAGYAWNEDRRTPDRKDLAAVGIGARLRLGERARLEIYWAEDLKHLDRVQERNLQDDGLHFQLSLFFP